MTYQTKTYQTKTYQTKLFGLVSIAAIAPIVLSSAANAQSYGPEHSQIELQPTCELIDCSKLPVFTPPRIIPVPCDPRNCDPLEFNSERVEIDVLIEPELEDIVQVDDVRDATRFQQFQQLKYDEFRKEPVLDPAGESAPPRKDAIAQYLKEDE